MKRAILLALTACTVAALPAAALRAAALPAPPSAAAEPKTVFACSLGRKSVSVRAEGGRLVYTFGAPGRAPEISVVASPALHNVWWREDRFAGMEHQLRIANAGFSYTVYDMEGNGRTGARAVSGLVVRRGAATVADLSCTRYAEFAADFPYESLPEDSEAFSAM